MSSMSNNGSWIARKKVAAAVLLQDGAGLVVVGGEGLVYRLCVQYRCSQPLGVL